MMVVGLWNGGASYAPSYSQDAELFDSIKEAKEALDQRRRRGYYTPQTFRYLFKKTEEVLTPTVEEDSYMDLYLFPDSQPLSSIEEIIDLRTGDRRLEFGPRGGIRQERF